MKTKTAFLFGLMLTSYLIFHTSFVLAQDSTPTPTLIINPTVTPTPRPTGFFHGIFEDSKKLIQGFRDDKKEARDEIKDTQLDLRTTITLERQNLKPTITQQRLDARRKNLQTLYDRIHSMLTQRFDFLNTAKTKITAKIAAKKTAGKDTSAAETKLATFDPGSYNTDLATFDKKFTDLLASATPGQMVKDLQASAKTVKNDLQKLQTILIDTMRLIIQIK